jgi:hypothetical protein
VKPGPTAAKTIFLAGAFLKCRFGLDFYMRFLVLELLT